MNLTELWEKALDEGDPLAIAVVGQQLADKMAPCWSLLHRVDGQLGLAVYRHEHDQRWKSEARSLIVEIRRVLAPPDSGAET